MTEKIKIQGKVERTEGDPNPHSFWILGNDGKKYFAHLGDLVSNSGKLLYNENGETEFLKEGEQVEFEPWKWELKNEKELKIERAFNVSRINNQ